MSLILFVTWLFWLWLALLSDALIKSCLSVSFVNFTPFIVSVLPSVDKVASFASIIVFLYVVSDSSLSNASLVFSNAAFLSGVAAAPISASLFCCLNSIFLISLSISVVLVFLLVFKLEIKSYLVTLYYK